VIVADARRIAPGESTPSGNRMTDNIASNSAMSMLAASAALAIQQREQDPLARV
jgi:hypothetical protein